MASTLHWLVCARQTIRLCEKPVFKSVLAQLIENKKRCCYERFTRAMLLCSRLLVQALVQNEPEQADLHLQAVIAALEQDGLRPQVTAATEEEPDAIHSNHEQGTMALQQAVDLYLGLDQQRMELEMQLEALEQFGDENAVCMARMAMQTRDT
ncbi:hypothetical protein BJV82DRAFT_622265 [Fennellomyces sp. T-0311]|nr:hypothetical protein BJV82DRAFT_622265 [Fennellomyces sp. T-0311]